MSIVLIGGHDRMHNEYKEMCSKFGHDIKVYTQMPKRLEKHIGNPDGIVLFTSTVSHQMVKTAVKAAKKNNIPLIRSHSSSAFSLKTSIQQLEGMSCSPA